jgi:hypothetical protein
VLSPLALGLFATLMVASAAYGLTTNLSGSPSLAQKVAAAQPQASGAIAAAPAPAPAATPPAQPPATTASPPAPTPSPPPSSPAPKPSAAAKPAAPATPKPAPSTPAPSSSPSTGGSSPPAHDNQTGSPARHHGSHAPSRPGWVSGADQPYSATLYDPYGTGTDEHASAAPKAVDGNVKSAWTTADHPGGLGKPGVGLVLEAGGYQSYSAIGIETATPGFRVEIYSTDASDPPAGGPSASGWRREGGKRGVAKQQRVAMKGATPQPTYLLVWITALPAGKPRAGLSELSLLP